MFFNSCLLLFLLNIYLKIFIDGYAAQPHNEHQQERPNIIIIIADDMGFDDVSFRGSNEFLTPNIDALAYSGVVFKNFYTPSMCTPSRAALLTGKYPIHTGMQHYVITNYQPWSLPLNETTMAEIFQQNGYFTSLIGKWHLGLSREIYTPTHRGFDHHFGYLGAYIDYFDHTLWSPLKTYARGHDFRRNLAVTHEHTGIYATEVLNDAAVKLIQEHSFHEKPLFLILSHLAPHSGNEDKPLQAPEEEIQKFSYIKNKNRRIYAAMMSELDKSVAHVINALNQRGILNNTILLFLSDNGGPTEGQHATTASNYPLKGQKNSPWEGGLRSSAAIWTSKLKNPGTAWSQQIHIIDLLPTFATAADINLSKSAQLDGQDLWQAILNADDAYNFERDIVHNIDDIANYVSYLNGKFKYVNGTTSDGHYDRWLGTRPKPDSGSFDPRAQQYESVIRSTSVWQQLQFYNRNNAIKAVNITKLRKTLQIDCNYAQHEVTSSSCLPLKSPCLFDIQSDPCEHFNLYEDPRHKKLIDYMHERIEHFRSSAHAPNNKPEDSRCDPRLYQYEWTWWEDLQDKFNNGIGRVQTTIAMQSFKNVMIILVLKIILSTLSN